MQRQLVSSSSIRSVGYDSAARLLEIEFQSGGTYQYFDVPESVYRELMKAESQGLFFHDHIRDKYQYEKIS